MERTFTYEFETGAYYLENSDEYEYDCVEFEYTVYDNDIKNAIIDILFDCYFSDKEQKLFNTNQRVIIKKALKIFTDDNDNWEKLAEGLKDDLMEYFEDDAYSEYKNRG